MKLSIVIAGVGGQGSLLASRILGEFAAELSLDVKVSEVHGMSQRGGSVTTFVRMGESVRSPMVELGEADYILALEQLEALRALPYLKQGGTLISATQKIMPMPVIVGAAQYPDEALSALNAQCDLVFLDALKLAKEAGEPRAVNLVLLGVLAKRLGMDEQLWLNAIERSIPERFLADNRRAFAAGYASV